MTTRCPPSQPRLARPAAWAPEISVSASGPAPTSGLEAPHSPLVGTPSSPTPREGAIELFDRMADRALDPLRNIPLVDLVSSVASAVGDHGLIWFALGLRRARQRGRPRTVAVRAVAFAGVVTPAVNSSLKQIVRRVRPATYTHRSLPVRIPRTTSFPSGHALAAWCAATLLADSDPLAWAYYSIATVISVSRVHLRLHHASDVVAGAMLGAGLGRLGRALFPIR